jgi:glutaconate CoA-transferase subunit A
VSAVVHAPWGAHPSPVPGYYNRDHDAFIEYRNESKTSEAFKKWLRLWVDNVKSSDDYLRLLGKERILKLELKKHMFSEPVDYGY